MGPVHHTPPLIPLIDSGKLDTVTCIEGIHPRRKIDVMGDQNSMPGSQAYNETLVSTAVKVIREQSHNLAFPPYLYIISPLPVGTRNLVIANSLRRCIGNLDWWDWLPL